MRVICRSLRNKLKIICKHIKIKKSHTKNQRNLIFKPNKRNLVSSSQLLTNIKLKLNKWKIDFNKLITSLPGQMN